MPRRPSGAAERPNYLGVLSRATVPTLVVVCRDDEFTPLSDAQLMHDRPPHGTLIVIDEAAHMPNLERPDEFNRALESFLGSVARAA